MRFWSEGLGDSELVIGLDRARLELKGDCVALTGVVDSPAPWEYEVKIQFDDWTKILSTATSKETTDFVALHMRLADLTGMAWSILKFTALLAGYRFRRTFRLAPVKPAPVKALEGPRTRRA
jgi:hypothetical protein